MAGTGTATATDRAHLAPHARDIREIRVAGSGVPEHVTVPFTALERSERHCHVALPKGGASATEVIGGVADSHRALTFSTLSTAPPR